MRATLDTHTHTHRVELLWMSAQLVAEAATDRTHDKHKRHKCIFAPAILAIKLLQMCALHCTATGFGNQFS